jgi:hypothetical protein
VNDAIEDRRRYPRRPLVTFFWCSSRSTGDYRVRTKDISACGLCGWTRMSLAVGQEISVAIGGIGVVRAAVVWTEKGYFGAKLDRIIDPQAVDLSEIKPVRETAPVRIESEAGAWI